MQTQELLQKLIEQTKHNINTVEKFKMLSYEILNYKESAEKWSVLECVEHLNLYGDHYFPEMEKAIQSATSGYEPMFKSGWLGKYFAESMLPKEKLNKMKTFKDKNPANSKLDIKVLDRFVDQQKHLLKILEMSSRVSLNKVRIKTTLSSLLRLKLGDTFQFVINHNIRHLRQAEKVVEIFKVKS
jgi:DinB superfamily